MRLIDGNEILVEARTLALAQQGVRKIDLMHKLFGKTDHTCGECSNFVSGQYNSKILRKCTVYGLTHSEASDWAKRWQACGKFNEEWNGNPIIEIRKRSFQKVVHEPCDGQIGFGEET